MSSAGPLENLELAVKMPLVLVLYTRNAHDTPNALLTRVPANQLIGELDRVQAVGLGPARTTVDLDAGRVDDDVADSALG